PSRAALVVDSGAVEQRERDTVGYGTEVVQRARVDRVVAGEVCRGRGERTAAQVRGPCAAHGGIGPGKYLGDVCGPGSSQSAAAQKVDVGAVKQDAADRHRHDFVAAED